jgi:hypothetical protein
MATAIYQSNCAAKNLWQKYEIFPNHLELHTHFGNYLVPFEEIERAEIFPPVLQSIRLHLRSCLPFALKLDAADFAEHIVLDKTSGFVRHVLFTPENPAEFKGALDQALATFRQNPSTSAA